MRERPILFSGPMVRAIVAGAKTQTRRPITLREFQVSGTPGYDFAFRDRRGLWNDVRAADMLSPPHDRFPARCPYGQPGDQLWVRETWGYRGTHSCSNDGFTARTHAVAYRADDARLQLRRDDEAGLPKQRDQRDGEDDWDYRSYLRNYWEAWRPSIHMPRWASRVTLQVTEVRIERLQSITEADAAAEGCGNVAGFRAVWQDIHGAEGRSANPWVWVVSFERVEAVVAALEATR